MPASMHLAESLHMRCAGDIRRHGRAMSGSERLRHQSLTVPEHRVARHRLREQPAALPVSIALRHHDGREVDLQPLVLTPDGGGDQHQPGGRPAWHYGPPTTGHINGGPGALQQPGHPAPLPPGLPARRKRLRRHARTRPPLRLLAPGALRPAMTSRPAPSPRPPTEGRAAQRNERGAA